MSNDGRLSDDQLKDIATTAREAREWPARRVAAAQHASTRAAFGLQVGERWVTVREVADLLSTVAGDEDCRYDYNDYCQTHFFAKPCAHEAVRTILAALAAQPAARPQAGEGA